MQSDTILVQGVGVRKEGFVVPSDAHRQTPGTDGVKTGLKALGESIPVALSPHLVIL